MSAPVLATKLYAPPPRPHLVQRARLLTRLNESRKLSLISAPAGFGKTTLVSEWIATLTPSPLSQGEGARNAGVRVAWLSLDEGDSNLARFLLYFVSAVQTIAPKCGENVLNMLQPMPSIEVVLTMLLNELTAIPDRFVVILDDYHTLDCKPIDDALTFLIDHQPPHMQLVITTREDPQLPLARLRARGQLTELRAADLRFTPDEAADFLNRVMGLNLSAEDISALENRTEGWIAGLQLAAISMQGRSDVAGFIGSFTGSHHFVLDYLLAEVLHQQTPEIQSFLLRTSILDRICAPLCEAVLGKEEGGRRKDEKETLASSFIPHPSSFILEYLERANLFIVSLDNERQWYRYHRLFADLLRQRLRQATSDVAQYHVRASQWYADNGFMPEAFQHAIAAKDFARAADVAELAWQGMDYTFQTAAWLGWIKQLPEEVICVRPVLCTQIGLAFMDAGKPEDSESRFQAAERLISDPSAAMVVAAKDLFHLTPALIAMGRAYNAQVQGELSTTVKYAELALQLLPADDVFRRAQATVTLNFTHWANGDLIAARQIMFDWMNAMQQLGNIVFVVASAFAVADIQVAQGRLREAVRTYQQALQLAADHGPAAQAITAHHHLGLALLYHEIGDAEAFAQDWPRAEELGKQTTLVDWPYRWRLAQARLRQDTGDFDTALDLLDEAQRVYVKNPVPDLRPIEALKAHVYLKQGRLSQAQAWVNKRGLSVNDEIIYLHEFEYITLARLLVAEGLAQPAGELLARLRQLAEAQDRLGSVIEISIVQALAYQAQGNTSAALAALDRALALAEPEGYIRIFLDEGEMMRSLIADFRMQIEKQMHVEGRKPIEYVNRLLAAFKQPTTIPQSATSNQKSEMMESLSPRESEVLRLIEQGCSNQEIADRLFLALSTVKGYTRTLFDKLQVQRRTEAVVRARELGLL